MKIARLESIGPLATFDASAKELPKRLVLFKWGQNETTRGLRHVGEKTLQVFSANQKAFGFDSVALDFEHNTVPGTEEYKLSPPPRLIAGTGKPFCERGVGVGIDIEHYTPEGTKFALDGHYSNISGAAAFDENGEVIFLHSGALARQGANFDAKLGLFSAAIGDDGKFIHTSENQIHAANPSMNKLIIQIFTALGLTAPKDDATDEQLAASAKEFLAKLVPAAPGTKALETFTARLDKIEKADPAAPLQTFAARLDKIERGYILDLAARDGKVVPAEMLPDKDGKGGVTIEALQTFVASAPVTVPLEQRTPRHVQTFSATGLTGATASEAEKIHKNCGVTKEDLDKYEKE